jgi:hypothetical protein
MVNFEIIRENQTLILQSNKNHILSLSGNVIRLVQDAERQGIRTHAHFDHIPEWDDYIAATSVPLIIEVDASR